MRKMASLAHGAWLPASFDELPERLTKRGGQRLDVQDDVQSFVARNASPASSMVKLAAVPPIKTYW